MSFDSFADFINMGGHGLYVWLAYGIGVSLIVANIVLPIKQGRELRRSLRRRFKREGDSA